MIIMGPTYSSAVLAARKGVAERESESSGRPAGTFSGRNATRSVTPIFLDPEQDPIMLPNNCFLIGNQLQPPSLDQRTQLDQLQVSHLETARSDIDNRGVRLKAGKSLKKGQVAGFYHGRLIRMRQLTDQESLDAGIRKAEDSTDSLAANRWVVWQYQDGEAQVHSRPPFYQADDDQYFYPTPQGKVYLGIDALDSSYPIANINCADKPEQVNISLVSCIDLDCVHSISGRSVQVQADLPESAYCILAVAEKNIEQGQELLMKYCDSVFKDEETDSKRFLLNIGDQYFLPPFCPRPVQIDYVTDNFSIQISPSHTDEQVAATDLLDDIAQALNENKTFEEIAARLHGVKPHPITHSLNWEAGDVQYLCDLTGIARIDKHPAGKSYENLAYLFHCTDASGKLDNQGRNYLAGYINSQLGCSTMHSLSEPVTLAEVPPYLESHIHHAEATVHSTHSQEYPLRSQDKRRERIGTAWGDLKKFQDRLNDIESAGDRGHFISHANRVAFMQVAPVPTAEKRTRPATRACTRKRKYTPDKKSESGSASSDSTEAEKPRKRQRQLRKFNADTVIPEGLVELRSSPDCPGWLQHVELKVAPLFSDFDGFITHINKKVKTLAVDQHYQYFCMNKLSTADMHAILEGQDQDRITGLLLFKIDYAISMLNDDDFGRLFSEVYKYLLISDEAMKEKISIKAIRARFLSSPEELFTLCSLSHKCGMEELAELSINSPSESERNNARYLILRLHDNKKHDDVVTVMKFLEVPPAYGNCWQSNHIESMRGELLPSSLDQLVTEIRTSHHTTAQTLQLFGLINQGVTNGLVEYILWRRTPTRFRCADTDDKIAGRLTNKVAIPGTDNYSWSGDDVREFMGSHDEAPASTRKRPAARGEDDFQPPAKRKKERDDSASEPEYCDSETESGPSATRKAFNPDLELPAEFIALVEGDDCPDWLRGITPYPELLFEDLTEMVTHIEANASTEVLEQLKQLPESFKHIKLSDYMKGSSKEKKTAFLLRSLKSYAKEGKKYNPGSVFSQLSATANKHLNPPGKSRYTVDSTRSLFLNSPEELFSLGQLVSHNAVAPLAKVTTSGATPEIINQARYLAIRLHDNQEDLAHLANVMRRMNVPPPYGKEWTTAVVLSMRGKLLPCDRQAVFRQLCNDSADRKLWIKFYALVNMGCDDTLKDFITWRRTTPVENNRPDSDTRIAKRLTNHVAVPWEQDCYQWTEEKILRLMAEEP